MVFDLTGRRAAALAAMLLVSAGLAACTTTEGTNAFTDPGTFEREVMDTTAAGIGLIPQPAEKADPAPRGPLVMPKDKKDLPLPEEDNTAALLPVDSDKVNVDTTGLTQADIDRMKHVRVVDLNTPDGRPLTKAEFEKLTARMKAFRVSGKRSIFVPPEQYFELTGDKQDLVCLAPSGELVPVNDPSCPAEIRKALLKKA